MMRIDHRRELFACPECGVDAGEYCISKQGTLMSRYVHPKRGPEEMSYNQWLYMREWLTAYSDIFKVPE